MYTMYGLKNFVDSQSETISKCYYDDAISNLKEFMEEAKNGLYLLEKRFQQTLSYDFEKFEKVIKEHSFYTKLGAEAVEKDVFDNVYLTAQDALDFNKSVFTALKENLSSLPKKLMPECSYFVLKANGEAIHQLGLMSHSFDDFFTAKEETDDYYIGFFWNSNFFNVYFRKSDVRPLTKEEQTRFNV